MSKELNNIAETVMDKIHDHKIKMRPRAYFIVGSILTFIGLVFSIFTAIFFVGLVRFSIRAQGPMASYRIDKMLSSFPWWTAVVAILGILAGLYLLNKYDFSYKIKPTIFVTGLVFAIIFAGLLVDIVGLNDNLARRNGMGRMMRKYIPENRENFMPARGMYLNAPR